MVYGTYNYSIHGVYKPTNITGGPTLYLTTAAASSFPLITCAKAIFGMTGEAAGPHPDRAASSSRIPEIWRRNSSTGGTKSDQISIGVALSSWLTRPSWSD